MKYMFKSLFHSSLKRMWSTVVSCSKKSNKPKLVIFFDMVYCVLKYEAGYVDYEMFEFYNLNKEQRKTILTRGKNNKIVKELNNQDYVYIMENKEIFNKTYKKYLNRDYLVLTNDNYNEFEKFVKNKEYIFVKPIEATGGKGAEKIKIEKGQTKELYEKLLSQKQNLIEEIAVQHEDISKLHPASINTIRIVTLRNKFGVTSIVASVIRMGTGNNVVDNFHSKGIYSPVDIETGKIIGNGYDRTWTYHKVHPTTKIKLIGYKLPLWEETKALVLEAAEVTKQIGLVGWDICIGKEKPSIIEANPYPGYDLYKREDNYGALPVFEKALNKQK